MLQFTQPQKIGSGPAPYPPRCFAHDASHTCLGFLSYCAVSLGDQQTRQLQCSSGGVLRNTDHSRHRGAGDRGDGQRQGGALRFRPHRHGGGLQRTPVRHPSLWLHLCLYCVEQLLWAANAFVQEKDPSVFPCIFLFRCVEHGPVVARTTIQIRLLQEDIHSLDSGACPQGDHSRTSGGRPF